MNILHRMKKRYFLLSLFLLLLFPLALAAQVNLTALKSELENDPVAIGYLKTGGVLDHQFDAANADLINDPTTSTVDNLSVEASDVRGQTTFDAFDGLTASETEWFSWLTASGEIPVTTELLSDLAGIGGISRWANADRPVMEPRMVALMRRSGSRGEVLFGVGTTITPSDIANAIDLL